MHQPMKRLGYPFRKKNREAIGANRAAATGKPSTTDTLQDVHHKMTLNFPTQATSSEASLCTTVLGMESKHHVFGHNNQLHEKV